MVTLVNNGSLVAGKEQKRAKEFSHLIDERFIDEHGLLRCNINRTTFKPFTENELKSYEITSSSGTKAGRWTYEDTFFVSGLYLWSMVEEYKCTQDPGCLVKANIFFDDLCCLVKKSFVIDSGFIGKPWGGYPSRETTLDQTFYLCMGLNAYIDVADSERKRIAQSIIIENTDWWIRREYYNFQTPKNAKPVWIGPSHVGGMMAQVYLAYVHSGNKRFLNEVQRLTDIYQADLFLTRQSSQWLGADKNGMKVRRIALWHHGIALALWLLNEKCPQRSTYWQERLSVHWHEELKLGLLSNGMARQCLRVNLADGREIPFRLDETGFLGERTEFMKNNNAQGWRWVGALESGCDASYVGLSAVLVADAAKWMKNETKESLMAVINGLTVNNMMRSYDSDGKQCFELRRHWLDSLSSKGLVAWLLTYWLAKRTGLL